MTPEQFGQMIKEKYPQYKDIDDRELAVKIAQKYPQYKDKIEEKQSFLENTVGFFDKTFGKAGQLLFGGTAEAVGGLIGSGIEATQQLAGGQPQTQFHEGLKDSLGFGEGSDGSTTLNPLKTLESVGFTALELFPGGNLLRPFFKTLPGGHKLAEAFGKTFSLIPERLQQSAFTQYAQALGATKQGMKGLSQKVVPELLEKRVTALTQTGLLNKSTAMRYAAGEALEDVLDTIPQGSLIKTQSIINQLDEVRIKALVKGTDVVANPQLMNAVDNVKGVVEKFGPETSFESLRSLRQIWDDMVTSGGKVFGRTLKEDSLLAVQREGSNAIRAELAKEFPDLARVNAEYSLWKSTETILEETLQRKTGQAGSLFAKGAQATGAITGAAAGGLEGAIIGQAALKQLMNIFQSTGWRTITAVQKKRLADALMKGDAETVETLIKEMTVVISNADELATNEEDKEFSF